MKMRVASFLQAKDTANSLTTLLHRTDWAFVGAVATMAAIVVAIVVPVILHMKERCRKRLTYRPSTTSLVAVDKRHRNRIEIRYDGKPVTDLSLVKVTIRHDGIGDVPMLKQDFQEPLRIAFGPAANVLTWEVARAWEAGVSPKIGPRVSEDGTSEAAEVTVIELQPLLLNQGDGMVLNFLVERAGDVSVVARIAGVSEVELDTYEPNAPLVPSWILKTFWVLSSLLLIVMTLLATILWPLISHREFLQAIIPLALWLLGSLGFWWFKRDRRPFGKKLL